MTDRSFVHANDESRERLARLVATLTPTQLGVDLGEGWTVASALAHAGFWDRWQAERWTQMLAGNWSADDASVIEAEHLANEALHPYWAGIESREIPALALDAAVRLDSLIAAAPDALVDALEGSPSAFLLHRHRHRADHLDHIERSLVAAGHPAPSGAPVERTYNELNDASRRRLATLVGRLTPAELARPTSDEPGSWTVGQILGHLAFWDRFLAARWRAAIAAGPASQPNYLPEDVPDLLNAALEPSLAALAQGSGAALLAEVVAAAEAIDSLIAGLAAEAPIEAILAERPRTLDRSTHRADHLDVIDRVLGR